MNKPDDSSRVRAAADPEDPTVGMDPLVARIWHNLTRSSLYSLPDELLLQIMELLGPGDVQRLRNSGRLFLRLFSFPAMKQHHLPLDPMLEIELRRPWVSPSILFLEQAKTKFRPLRDAEASDLGLCKGCQHARQQGD